MRLKAEQILSAIDEGHAASRKSKAPRAYIGASGIGNPCDAYQELSLRGFRDNDLDPRLLRIFELGHKIEDIVVSDLKDMADVRVWEKNPETNYQWEYKDFGGHVKCHTDGLCTLEDAEDASLMILEIKSMNRANWDNFKTQGVRKSHRKYWDQMQLMMHMAKTGRAMFVAYNKDTSAYHIEFVEADEIEVSYLVQRIERVLSGQARKISDDPKKMTCRMCFKSESCWNDKEADVTCTTCAFSSPLKDGTWRCNKHGGAAVTPCDDWEKFRPKEKI